MEKVSDLTSLGLDENAFSELKEKIRSKFEVKSFILFGSVSRGDNDIESDIDLLVLTVEPVTHRERHVISDIITDINLEYGTNISVTVIDGSSWDDGMYNVLPFHDEVERDGLVI